MNPNQPRFSKHILGAWILPAWSLLAWSLAAQAQPDVKLWTPEIPKVWDEVALADWATPVAGLNVRPTHISANEYYSFTVDNLRTYLVYFPGKEPEGYWEMLQSVGPKSLIEPGRLKTEADWIEAGRRVFEGVDDLDLRTFDPKFIAAVRTRETAAPAASHVACGFSRTTRPCTCRYKAYEAYQTGAIYSVRQRRSAIRSFHRTC